MWKDEDEQVECALSLHTNTHTHVRLHASLLYTTHSKASEGCTVAMRGGERAKDFFWKKKKRGNEMKKMREGKNRKINSISSLYTDLSLAREMR